MTPHLRHFAFYFSFVALMVIGLVLWPRSSLAQKPFYEGRTVSLLAASGPGSGVDIIARALARVLPKHIAGQPRMIVRNMPGAGGVIAMNYAYKVVAPDGLTILAGVRGEVFPQLVEVPAVEYDITKFRWLGTVSEESNGVFVSRRIARTFRDLLKVTEPVKMGATGVGSAFHLATANLEHGFNIPIRYIFGYRTSVDVGVAFTRGEVEGFAAAIRIMAAQPAVQDAMAAGDLVLVAQTAKERDPLFPDVPSIWEFIDHPKAASGFKEIVRALSVGDQTGKYYALPPGTPDGIFMPVKHAFWSAVHDPQFVAAMEKFRLAYNPRPAEEIQGLLNWAVYEMPREQQNLIREIFLKKR